MNEETIQVIKGFTADLAQLAIRTDKIIEDAIVARDNLLRASTDLIEALNTNLKNNQHG